MKQSVKNYLTSAAGGFGLVGPVIGALALGTGLLCLTLGAPVGIALSTVTFVTISGAATLASSLLAMKKYSPYESENVKWGALGGAMLATFVAGVALLGMLAPDRSQSNKIKTPVENTRCKCTSFLNHKNTFNASAQNSKKTLVLTAKDFSQAPGAKAA
jgi:hypothetical protein